MRVGGIALALCCALAAASARAADSTGPQAASLGTGAPPRTVTDITGVLGAYKPDPQRAAAAKAAADEPPPAGQSDAELAAFYLRRGAAAGQVGRITQRLDDLRQALAHAEKAGIDRSRFLGPLMNAEASSNNFADAIHHAEERAEIDDRQGARPRLFITYRQLVHFNVMRANLREADKWVERLRALYAESQNWGTRQQHGAPRDGQAGEPGGGRGGGQGGGGGHRQRGAQTQAQQDAGPTPGSDRFTVQRPNWRSNVAAAEADVLEARGRPRAAEASLRTAIEQFEEFLRNRTGQPPVEGFSSEAMQQWLEELVTRLSSVLQHQGKFVEAELEARRALTSALKTVGRYHARTAQRLAQLTWAVQWQGRVVEAEQLARATIAIYEAVDATKSWGLAGARAALGSTLVAQERWSDALAVYQAMMTGLAGDPIGTRRFGFGNFDWATALIRTGHAEPAIAMINRELERRRKFTGEQSYATAFARGFLGMALAAEGKREPALQAFRDSVPTLMSKPPQSADDGPSASTHRLHLVLDAYIRLLAEIRGTPIEANAKIDAAAEAFQAADAARGQTVQKAVDAASARVTLRDPALADLARQEQDRGQELAGLESTLADALSTPADQQDAHAIDVLRDQINQLRTTRDNLRQQIARRFPDYAQLISPKPATIETARQALKPSEALFASYVSDEATFVWAVSQQGPGVFAKTALGRKQLNAAVRQLRRALDPEVDATGAIPRFDVALASELYETLLKPVEPGWKGASSLLVVTGGALAELPLGVLVTAPTASPADPPGQPMFAGYKAVPFLARQVAITDLPSVATLPTLRALPPAGNDRKPFVGFGDPVFSAHQNGPAQVADAGTLTTRGAKLHLRSAPKTEHADSAELAMLPRLPDTAEEVRSIARALHADPDKDVFVGAAANEHTVETMTLSDRRVIAFATHGLVPGDLNGLTEPALALSAPAVAGGSGDGLLTMDEVLALKLNADWVVLSACNTAAGNGAGAEAVSGLGRAFFYAGARALLVSNWPVETNAARALTTDLFRRQAENPRLGRAEALRQAELALIDGAGAVDPATKQPLFSYAHPIFWAPFSLVGDGGGGRTE